MIHKIWMMIPQIGLSEYSNTKVILAYDQGLQDDSQFQYLIVKEAERGPEGIRITVAMDYEFPKRSYLVLAKQILDEIGQSRAGKSTEEFADFVKQVILDRIEQLILQTGSMTHLRFSKQFKLPHITWNDPQAPRIGLFGLDQSGKSSVLATLSTGIIASQYSPTRGMNRVALKGILGADWTPLFLEFGGAKEFRPLWNDYGDFHAIIFVIDADDRRRFPEAVEELHKLAQKQPEIPLLIISNKQDIPTSMTVPDTTAKIEATLAKNTYRRAVFPVSALTGEGLPAAFHWLLEYVWFLRQDRKNTSKT